ACKLEVSYLKKESNAMTKTNTKPQAIASPLPSPQEAFDDVRDSFERFRPQYIAFIRPGQKALVKISAYDFTIYGGLDGVIEIISSDSIYEEQTKESYYIATIRTSEIALEKNGKVLPIIPGMVASVDIITGKKTILDYLLKPITKARYEALTER
ncbi:MAG: hypothetical protein GY927_20285, partial [bacterium]|nr:hypothetical protein [bacterium]